MSRDLAAVKTALRRSARVVGSVTSVRTTAPQLVMTYDDGPEPGGTDAVLAALADAGVTATFFVLLTRVRLYPSLFDDLVAEGHEIALHGADHRRLTTLGVREVYTRTVAAKSELEDRAGAPVRWIRPPYGAQTPLVWAALRRSGLRPVLWGPSSWDWKPVSQDERVRRVAATSAPGVIVLGHDGFADERDGVTDGPAPEVDKGDLTRRLLAGWEEQRLRPVTLTEALQHGSAVTEAVFRR